MGRVALDNHCSRHASVRCTNSSPVHPVSQPPEACVDIEVLQGEAGTAVSGDDAYPVQCVRCPGELLPTGGLPACDSDSLAQAQRGRVLFNISGATVAHLETLYAQVIAARAARIAQLPPAEQRDPDRRRAALSRQTDWSVQIETMIREIAPQIGYCEPAPFGQFAVNRGWRYAERGHRVDLDADISFRGEGEFGSTTLGTSTVAFGTTGIHSFLQVYLTAFYASPQGGHAADPTLLDLDGLVIALLHEMRHMGSPGLGMPEASNATVANAERFLNELEDYARMFDHPYLIGLDPSVVQRLRAEFGAGRNTMYGCFANVWSTAGPPNFPGYPDDSERAVGMALGMSMPGFGGLQMPILGLGGRAPGVGLPGGFRLVWPHVLAAQNWNPTGWSASQCTSSGLPVRETPGPTAGRGGSAAPARVVTIIPLTSPGQRCEVARWAAQDLWMRSKMVRSMSPSEEHQPWNTLAHWVLALPFRGSVYAACGPSSVGTG